MRSCWERAHAAYAAADAGQALDGSDGGGGLPRVVRASLLQVLYSSRVALKFMSEVALGHL